MSDLPAVPVSGPSTYQRPLHWWQSTPFIALLVFLASGQAMLRLLEMQREESQPADNSAWERVVVDGCTLFRWKDTGFRAARECDTNQDGIVETRWLFDREGRLVSITHDADQDRVPETFETLDLDEKQVCLARDDDEDNVFETVTCRDASGRIQSERRIDRDAPRRATFMEHLANDETAEWLDVDDNGQVDRIVHRDSDGALRGVQRRYGSCGFKDADE